MRAYVLIRVKGGEKDLVNYLRKQEIVKEAAIVYGEYDVVCVVETEDPKALSRLVLDDIRSQFNVERTSTLIVVEHG